jgi:hypothetical protein
MVRDAGDYVVAVLAHGSGGVGHCGSGAEIGIQGRLIAGVESHVREAHHVSVRFQAERKMRFATRAVPAAAMAVTLLVTACGSAGSGGSASGGPSSTHAPASSTTSAGGGAMTLTFTVFMTGAAAASGSFSVKYPPPPVRSCSSWFDAYSELPEVAESVGGHYFYMVVALKPGEYHGPGTYAIPFTAALEAVDLGSHEFGMTGAKLKVNADGSGSLSFRGAHGVLGEIDSGTIRWTCS